MWPFKKNENKAKIANPVIPSAEELKKILLKKQEEELNDARKIISKHFENGLHPLYINSNYPMVKPYIIDKLTPELEGLGYEVLNEEYKYEQTIENKNPDGSYEHIKTGVMLSYTTRTVRIKGGYNP